MKQQDSIDDKLLDVNNVSSTVTVRSPYAYRQNTRA